MPYKIITVDDSRTIRTIVKNAFKEYECEVIEAQNGKEGLDLVSQDPPQLIILDITMPVMTGIEMLSKLKENDALKSIPVIMLTAESGKDHVMQIVKMGASDYMVKPFKGEQLLDRVKKIIDIESLKKDGKAITAGGTGTFHQTDDKIQVFSLPSRISKNNSGLISTSVKNKLTDMKRENLNRFVLDMTQVTDIDMRVIQLMIMIIDKCRSSNTKIRLLVTESQKEAFKNFQETSSIPVDLSMDQLRVGF